jgi:CBS domain-containing protein
VRLEDGAERVHRALFAPGRAGVGGPASQPSASARLEPGAVDAGRARSIVPQEVAMLVQEILDGKGHEVITAAADATVKELADVLTEHNIGAVLVVAGDRILGVASERDLVRAIAERGADAIALRFADIMTCDLEVCGPDASIDAVMALMTARRVRHLPVLERGKLVGLVSIGDVVKRRVEEIEAEAHMLRDYVEAR